MRGMASTDQSSQEGQHEVSRPSPSMVVAGIALFVSLGGTSIAAVSYATRAGSVDGKSAVFAGASLVAGRRASSSPPTARGTDKGRLPGKFVADVAEDADVQQELRGRRQRARRAADGRDASSGLGTLTATCNDQNAAAGNEDPISAIRSSTSPASADERRPPRRQRRRRADASAAEPDGRRRSAIGGSNTFTVPHRAAAARTRSSSGGVRQDGRGTPAATCVVFGVVTRSCRSELAGVGPVSAGPVAGRTRSPAGCRSGGWCSGSWSGAGPGGT